MTEQTFRALLEAKGIVLTDHQMKQFDDYYTMLIEVNQKMNLTAITDKEAVYEKHFYDSLSIGFNGRLNKQTLCDVGGGAGFPSVPLKIAFPEVQVTVVDSLDKRIKFLKEVQVALDLKGFEAVSERAEVFALTHRETFDVVTARAVARLNILLELCLPLTRKGGIMMALKGNQGQEEIKEAQGALMKLGGEIIEVDVFHLPKDQAQRVNVYIKKTKHTPIKYPRNYSQIKKKPL